MAYGLALSELVEVRLEGGGGDGEVVVQEAEEVWGGGAVDSILIAVLDGDELDAVAGGEDESFADSGLLGEGACGVCEAGQGNGKALAEFERDLLRERVRSGIAAARKRGVVFGRKPGQRVKADRHTPKVLQLVEAGQSYREISHRLGISKNTVLGIVKRDRASGAKAA